jgi:hypothetical protein
MSSRAHNFHRALLGCGLGALLAGSVGCEQVPDPCAGYKLACLAVTVNSGPADLYRLRVDVANGLDSYTELTPKKPPKGALVYPLRFAVRFGQFDQRYRGQLTFVARGLNQDFDTIAEVATTVALAEAEKKALTIDLGPPLPDLATAPTEDAGTPDQGTATDLRP